MALERLREHHYWVSLPFVSSLVPGSGGEKEIFFLFYVHTYRIHIYLYHSLTSQKVEFPMESLFLIIVFKCDQDYNIVQLL